MQDSINPSAYQPLREFDQVPNREGFVEFQPLTDAEFRAAVFGKRLALGDTYAAAKKYADEKLAERSS